MPQSVPAGLTREHVLRTLSELDAGLTHPFGTATGNELVHDQKRYVPTAVVGLACRFSIGRMLAPKEFSSGEGPGQANFVLRKLGFTVVNKENKDQEQKTGKDWTESEVRLVVSDYFAMLESELMGELYKKTAHRKALIPKLSGRSDGSIEFKHQNISGVLVEMGLPYIEGYKPRCNYQSILAKEVEAYLEQQTDLLTKLALSPTLNPTQLKIAPQPNLDEVIEAPPETIYSPTANGKPWITRKASRLDFAERDASNRKLGQMGEEFVFELEKYRLHKAGRDDLAQKVTWASRDIGDGLGFDILSFDETDETERMLEVKATGLGKFFPFYVTNNEVRCSEDIPEQYQLFRVFDFGKSPRLYILHGSLRQLCQLEPVLYRAVV
jgi:hypothetical protein